MKNFQDIITSYNQLPYVVIRKKYLIPTFPFPNLNLEQFKLKKSSGIINGQFPFFQNPAIRQSYVKFIASELPKDNSYQAYKQAFALAKKEYIMKYIRPAQRVNMRPYAMYFKLNYARIASEMQQFSLSQSYLLTFKLYNSLPKNQKEFYHEAARVWAARQLEQVNQFKKSHQIPPLGSISLIAAYTQKYKPLSKQRRFSKELYERRKQLSYEQHQELKAMVEELNIKRKHVLNDFLDKYGITLAELKNIKKISILYDEARKSLRDFRGDRRQIDDKSLLSSSQGEPLNLQLN